MNRLPDQSRDADERTLLADDDESIDGWTLDELERSADLGSVRSAWSMADDAFA